MSTTSNVLLKDIYPQIEKSLKDPKTRKGVAILVNKYIDRNTTKLTTVGPMERTIFSHDDKNKLLDLLEVSAVQIKNSLKTSTYIKGSWRKIADPFYIACVFTIRYATIHKDKDLLRVAMTYFTLSLYPSLHYKYFKYPPVANVMAYTINNLSNKYKIRQEGTIYFALISTVENSHENEIDDIKRGYDKDVVDYINSSQARLNSMMKNISKEYYHNHKNHNYLNLEEDNLDPDNYHMADSNIYNVEQISNGVLLKLIVDGPNIKLIDYSAKLSGVSSNELRNYINTLVTNDNKKDLKTMIESILFLYLYDDKNKVDEIRSSKFLLYCLDLYRKSNTQDKNILVIKSILDKWIKDIDIYKKTQRLATINDFRRAIYLFFVISIQTNNKN